VPVHFVAFPAEHCPHEPPGWQAGDAADIVHSLSPPQARHVRNEGSQTGVEPPQSASARHPTHSFVLVLQTGAAAEHWLDRRHWTHDAIDVSQTGVEPLHSPMFVAEHARHAPLAWQAGAVAGHCASAVHGPHVCVAVLQMGVVPLQFESARHATHRRGDTVVRQLGVVPLQSELDTHCSANTLVVCVPVVTLSPSDG
jgi:hypothetical protein